MKPLFIVASIVGAPFFFWFLRRRSRPRPNKERDQADQATPSSNLAKLDAALEMPLSPEEVPPKPEEAPLATSRPANRDQLLNEATLSPPAALAFDSAPASEDNDQRKPLEVLGPSETELPPKPEDLPAAASVIDAFELPNEAEASLHMEHAILDSPYVGANNSLSIGANYLEMLSMLEEVLPFNIGDMPVASWSPVNATYSPGVAET